MTYRIDTLLAVSSLLLLAACGGGGSSTDQAGADAEGATVATPGTAPPADATSGAGEAWYAGADTAPGAAANDAGLGDAALAGRRNPPTPTPPPSPPPTTPPTTQPTTPPTTPTPPTPPVNVSIPPAGTDDAARLAAATATATSSTNLCVTARPFYWEIGSKDSKLASGSVDSSTVPGTYTSSSMMSIASASKWLYGSYVAQRLNGALSDSDRKYLSMRSGYISLSNCDRGATVASCATTGSNGVYTASADNKFDYDGGHFEKHATLLGLGALSATTLATEVKSKLGTDVNLSYSQPLLAGGAVTTPDGYARVLRKMLGGQLVMGSLLGSQAVCTNPVICGRDLALYAPLPPTESWHYSVAHWVEDDPVVGDGAFSSPGAFGFYPWIDKSKTYYGVLARAAQGGNAAFPSVQCGRIIRKAWLTGVAQ